MCICFRIQNKPDFGSLMSASRQTEYLNICHLRVGFNCYQLQLDVWCETTKEGILLLFWIKLSVWKHLFLWCGGFSFSSFFPPCHYQSHQTVPDASEKSLMSWSFCNRSACLNCVHCSRKQKPKWGLWKRKLWKRTRQWIVSNKNLLGICLWWVHILCFLKLVQVSRPVVSLVFWKVGMHLHALAEVSVVSQLFSWVPCPVSCFSMVTCALSPGRLTRKSVICSARLRRPILFEEIL